MSRRTPAPIDLSDPALLRKIARLRPKMLDRERAVLDHRILSGAPASPAELGLPPAVVARVERVLLIKLRQAASELRKEGRACRLCGLRLRRHNTRDVCGAHGGTSFDRVTGECTVCGAIVPARERGAHALHHAIRVKAPGERRALNRDHTARRRADRKAAGRCTQCDRPAIGGRLCVRHTLQARARGERLRRRRGAREKKLVTLTHGGETRHLAEWARRTGIDVRVLWDRFVLKEWPPARVLEPTKNAGARARDKPRCAAGHPRTPENLYVHRGKRHCRVCMSDRTRARRAAEKARRGGASPRLPVLA